MTEVTTEVSTKSKKGPQGPIKNYFIVNMATLEFWSLDEYCEANHIKNKGKLRSQLNDAFETNPAKTIRVPVDHPALVLKAGAVPSKLVRYLIIGNDGLPEYTSKVPESYYLLINLKDRTFTNAEGTFPLPWEKGEFLGTRKPKKAKAAPAPAPEAPAQTPEAPEAPAV